MKRSDRYGSPDSSDTQLPTPEFLAGTTDLKGRKEALITKIRFGVLPRVAATG